MSLDEIISIVIAIGIACWIILQFLIILWLALYCRIMRKLSSRKQSLGNVGISPIEEQGDMRTGSLRKIYNSLSPYLYGLMRYYIVRVGHIPSFRVRRFFYKNVFCMQITQNTVIYGGCEIRSPWNIKADYCVILNNCLLDGRFGIEIGDNVVFGVGVRVWTAEHSVNDPNFQSLPANCQPVKIGGRAWICSDSTILPGIVVGEGAVLAARACLTKNAESYGIYAGIPAKKIAERTTNLIYKLDGKPIWHFY